MELVKGACGYSRRSKNCLDRRRRLAAIGQTKLN
jgi:hypothetical protein